MSSRFVNWNPDHARALQQLMVEAGDLIISYRPQLEVAAEKSANEIVTSADVAANDLITARLPSIWRDLPIYSEEDPSHRSEAPTRWIVDPLDGTTPWVWGNSGFAVSVALEVEGRVEVGAVYDPVMKEFFYAQRGTGATRNGQAISPSTGIELQDAYLVVDWGNDDAHRQQGIAYFSKFFVPKMVARRVLPQFAPALGLCRIAEGRIHGLVCNDTWLEDHSAAALILSEAGGHVTNFDDTAGFNHQKSGIIAASDISLHRDIALIL